MGTRTMDGLERENRRRRKRVMDIHQFLRKDVDPGSGHVSSMIMTTTRPLETFERIKVVCTGKKLPVVLPQKHPIPTSIVVGPQKASTFK